ncbi:MAG: metallophosphoesterase [Spirochaetales bacterium]|nr:metallophosphoesterase [Spirochaetales bacterium]
MKIVFITDIHDALHGLKTVLTQTQADLYLLCGDILYKAFYDEDKLYNFVCLQEEFWEVARKLQKKIFPFDLATDILRRPAEYGKSEDLMLKAADYRLLFNKAAKTMKEKYTLIEELINRYSNASCLLLPGNYDIDLHYTALEHRNLHHSERIVDDFKFAGYGGAPVATSGIPEKLALVYHERTADGSFFSEPEQFFNDTEPDVLVLHNPAYGFFDRIPHVGHVGSIGIRNYLDSHRPRLVVSGHVHEDYGVRLKDGVCFVNPSNFGGVDSPFGFQPGGTFAEIMLEKDGVRQVNLMQLKEDVIHTLMEIDCTGPQVRGRILPGAQERTALFLNEVLRSSAGEILTAE